MARDRRESIMSTPSKKRRQARAWMSRVTKQHKLDVIAGMNQERERANREWREKLTRIIPPDEDGIIYPMGRLEQPYIYISAPTEFLEYAEPFDPMKAMQRFQDVRPHARFDAKQMAHVLPNGAKVVWWTWEIQR